MSHESSVSFIALGTHTLSLKKAPLVKQSAINLACELEQSFTCALDGILRLLTVGPLNEHTRSTVCFIYLEHQVY